MKQNKQIEQNKAKVIQNSRRSEYYFRFRNSTQFFLGCVSTLSNEFFGTKSTLAVLQLNLADYKGTNWDNQGDNPQPSWTSTFRLRNIDRRPQESKVILQGQPKKLEHQVPINITSLLTKKVKLVAPAWDKYQPYRPNNYLLGYTTNTHWGLH